MNVEELIEELKKYDPKTEIYDEKGWEISGLFIDPEGPTKALQIIFESPLAYLEELCPDGYLGDGVTIGDLG